MTTSTNPSATRTQENQGVETKTAPQPHIDDIAPHRTRNFNDLLHAAIALFVGLIVIFSAVYLNGLTSGVEADAHSAGRLMNWLYDVPTYMLQQLASFIIVITVLIQLMVNREWLQSASSVIALFFGYATVRVVSLLIVNTGMLVLIAAIRSPGAGAGASLLPDLYAGIAAFLTVAGPRRSHSTVKWGWNIILTVAVVFVIVSWHSVAGAIVSFTVGRIIGLLIRFAVGTRNQGLWGMGIVQALKGIGLNLTELSRHPAAPMAAGVLQAALDDDLIENSRIYEAIDQDGAQYIVSVLDSQPHTAGYLNQIWQALRFTGVTIRRDRSASDAIHHHYAMLLGLESCGLDTLKPYGVADSEESSILVFSKSSVLSHFDLTNLSDDDMADFLRYLNTANRRGYTHRRITPDTLATLHNPGEKSGNSKSIHLIAGWQNGDYASLQANAAMDKVQLLVLLSALTSPERAIRVAENVWGVDTLTALAPFVQKVAVPSATRTLPGWNKQLLSQVRDQLTALTTEDEDVQNEPVTLARFNFKSFFSLTLAIIAVAVIFTQLRPNEVIDAVRNAKPGWALACMGFSLLAWVGASLVLGAFMDKDKRNPLALYCSQAASGFTAVSMPAGVGPAFVDLQFLRKSGYRNTTATAITTAAWAVQSIGTIAIIVLLGLITGRTTFSGMIPTNTLVVVIGAVVLIVCLCMAITPLRRLIINKYLPLLRSYAMQLLDVLTQPTKLTGGTIGSITLNVATALGFWVALLAFGHASNPIETMFVFLLANTLGSAAPTPGGLGAIEAALTFAFTSVGVPPAVALSATLLYRVCFYWLRIPLGALAMKWLDRHNLM
jgi:glycosyltransferase 2 family protein